MAPNPFQRRIARAHRFARVHHRTGAGAQEDTETLCHLWRSARCSVCRLGDICLTHGFGEQKAAQLQAVLEFAKRLAVHSPTKKYQILCSDDAAAFVRMEMMYLDVEHTRVLVLNTQHEVIANHCLYQGTINCSVFRVPKIFRPAIARNACSIVVCHNHPSGDPSPSPEDEDMTMQLVAAGQVLDISVVDHIIIGNPRYISLRERMRW